MVKKRLTRMTATILLGLLFSPLIARIVPTAGIESITPWEMKDHVYFLASDSMKGRNTPSPELDSCAVYIANEFKSYGLKPTDGESYFQTFYVQRAYLGESNTLSVQSDSKEMVYQIKNDFVPIDITANGILTSLPVVFAGFGITAPEYQYDDYEEIGVQNKVVMVFTGEPQEKDSTSIFEGTRQTDYSKPQSKAENAIEHGAAGLILISNPTKPFRRPPNPWPSLMRKTNIEAVPISMVDSKNKKIIGIQIGKKAAQELMEGSGKTLSAIYQEINQTLIPQSFELKGKKVSIQTTLNCEKFPTHNVIGLLEGSDPVLKDEVIIVGAHYDHVGSVGDKIYNGADDNASGTAGVLEVAEAFVNCEKPPKRSVLFITFSGEEKNLFGSKHYVNNPLFPIEKTVAMLNMDMISRCDTNEAVIIGSTVSAELKNMNETANEAIEMNLAYDMDYFFKQSDHYTFYKKNIPVLFYSSDESEDLHRPADDPEKVIPEKMARIAKLVFSTAWIAANSNERPGFKEIDDIRIKRKRD